MNENSTIVKVIQELISDLAKHYNLEEENLTEFVAEHLEDSEIIEALQSKPPKIDFNDTKDNSKE